MHLSTFGSRIVVSGVSSSCFTCLNELMVYITLFFARLPAPTFTKPRSCIGTPIILYINYIMNIEITILLYLYKFQENELQIVNHSTTTEGRTCQRPPKASSENVHNWPCLPSNTRVEHCKYKTPTCFIANVLSTC